VNYEMLRNNSLNLIYYLSMDHLIISVLSCRNVFYT